MRRSKSTFQKKPVMIVRIIKTPIRALRKAKDIYIKGITIFSATYNRPIMVAEDSSTTNRTNKIFNDQIHHQPPKGLVRANSSGATHICITDLERDMIQKQNRQLQSCGSRKSVSKSCGIAMVKIDEDKVSSFREDNIIFKRKMVVINKASRLSRSSSYAGNAF